MTDLSAYTWFLGVSLLLAELGNAKCGTSLAGQGCNLCLSKYTDMLADGSVTSDTCLVI